MDDCRMNAKIWRARHFETTSSAVGRMRAKKALDSAGNMSSKLELFKDKRLIWSTGPRKVFDLQITNVTASFEPDP